MQAIMRRLVDKYWELRAANLAPSVALMREAVNPAVVVANEEPTLVARFAEFREVLAGRGHAFHTLRHYKTATVGWVCKAVAASSRLASRGYSFLMG
jgi:integrase/recombinase XerD